MLFGISDAIQDGLQLNDLTVIPGVIVESPSRRPFQIQRLGIEKAFRVGQGQFAYDFVQAESAFSYRQIDHPAVFVQPVTVRFQHGPVLFRILQLRPAEFQSSFQFLEELLLVGLVAVQLQAGVADMGVGQPPLDDLESRDFLCHEQHGLVIGHGVADQIGDRLRFAGARRSLDDQGLLFLSLDDGLSLRTVRIHDLGQFGDAGHLIQIFGVTHRRRRLAALIRTEQGLDDRVIARGFPFRPLVRIEVFVQEEFAEGEKAELNFVGLHFPAILTLDAFADLPKIPFRVESVRISEFR